MMMLRYVLLAVLACSDLIAQTANVTVAGKVWPFSIPAPLSVTNLSCDKSVLNVGETSYCVVTISGIAPAGGFAIPDYHADAPLVLSPTALVVPVGGTVIQFSVTRPNQAAMAPALSPVVLAAARALHLIPGGD